MPTFRYNYKNHEMVKIYQKLVKRMEQYLSNLKVYKVGKIEIDIDIIGRTNTGNYAGLATVYIET
ncbi:MAG: hypothetical protein O4861_15870 [Trichodesmium sp. St16_bin4-tuft]|nr:hypothetical protein [Trichodesmium sp. St16_bin4-tuft]MDE5103079.1 hypothetical protein [Trichodesmium sp. St19_bin2]